MMGPCRPASTTRMRFAPIAAALCLAGCAARSTPQVAPVQLPDSVIARLPQEIDVARPMKVARRPAGDDGTDFLDAIVRADLEAARRAARTNEETRLVAALAFVIGGDDDGARRLLDSLGRAARDSSVRHVSQSWLAGLLWVDQRWADVRSALPMPGPSAATGRALDLADVRVWAETFRPAPRSHVRLGADSTIFPLLRSPVGAVMLPVEINGHRFLFWLDTGASMTMLASDVAAVAGVTAFSADSLEVATAIGRVAARAAIAGELGVGPLILTNAPAMIVRADAFQLPDFGGTGRLPVKIDGIIGWDVIRRLDIRIDNPRETLVMRPPPREGTPARNRNLFWLGFPLVRMVAGTGAPVNFGLDTGLESTFLVRELADRLGLRVVDVERRRIGAIGADSVMRVGVVPSVQLNIGRASIILRRVIIGRPGFGGPVHVDGVLGADIGLRGVIRLDATNGLLLVTAR